MINMMKKSKKIPAKEAIVMFYDDAIREYAEMAHSINAHYCKKHNIDLIVHHEPFYTDRHAAWNRIPLILQHLQNYRHVAYIDADAFFYWESGNIFKVCSIQDKDFYFSNDRSVDRINSGFFMVKNSSYAHKFLETWAYDEELYQSHKDSPFWDQSALNDLYDSNFEGIKERSILYDYGFLQHFRLDEEFESKPYIYHAAGKKRSYRIDTFREYMSYVEHMSKKSTRHSLSNFMEKIESANENPDNPNQTNEITAPTVAFINTRRKPL